MSGKRVLALHPGALGDVVLFGHLLWRLGRQVTLISRGGTAGLLAGLGAVQRAIDFDALPLHELMTDTPVERCTLPARLGRHDRVVTCFPDGPGDGSRLAQMCGAARAEVLPVRPPADAGMHLVDLWADRLAVPRFRPKRPWPVPAEWREQAAAALAAVGMAPDQPLVAIHPGAGSPAKCWPEERFAQLASRIPPRARPVVLLGPVERDRGLTVRSFAGLTVLDDLPLATLAGLLSRTAAYVGNDSGVSHLSAAVGTPTIALFGPTRPEQFAPLGTSVRILTDLPAVSVTEVTRSLERDTFF